MNGAVTHSNDEYLSTLHPVRDLFGKGSYYISKIEPLFDEKLHHLIINGCVNRIEKSSKVMSTSRAPCGEPKILYAWAQGAGPLQLPKDAAIRIGKNSGINSIKIECHYKDKFKGIDTYSGIRVEYSQRPPEFLGSWVLHSNSSSIICIFTLYNIVVLYIVNSNQLLRINVMQIQLYNEKPENSWSLADRRRLHQSPTQRI